MDSKELKLKLEPFRKQCELDGIKIADILIKEAYPETESYYVDVCIPTVTAENYKSILDRTFNILINTIDKKTRTFVFTYCVINESI